MTTLKWTTVNTLIPEYSLADNKNNMLGCLKFPDITKTIAKATCGSFSWTFGRSGVIQPYIEVRTVEKNPQALGKLTLNSCGVSLLWIGATLYQWKREWSLSPVWEFRDAQCQQLMLFSPSKSPLDFSVKVTTGSIADSLLERDRVLLEMLGFYVLIVIKQFD